MHVLSTARRSSAYVYPPILLIVQKTYTKLLSKVNKKQIKNHGPGCVGVKTILRTAESEVKKIIFTRLGVLDHGLLTVSNLQETVFVKTTIFFCNLRLFCKKKLQGKGDVPKIICSNRCHHHASCITWLLT